MRSARDQRATPWRRQIQNNHCTSKFDLISALYFCDNRERSQQQSVLKTFFLFLLVVQDIACKTVHLWYSIIHVKCLKFVRRHLKIYSPQIFRGASSSSRIGWLRKISRDLRQRPRISFSVSWTFLPGLEPFTLKQKCHRSEKYHTGNKDINTMTLWKR